MSAEVDLVIFDCDGVLVDTERLIVAVEARVLTELGWPHTTEEVVGRWMGRSSASQLAELEAVLGAERTAEFDKRTTRETHQAFERELVAVPGVVDLLDHLDQTGLATCVASSGTHEKMRLTLGLTGLLDRFTDRIFSATEVTAGKPAPDLFLHAARRMGADPASCVVVEDSAYGVEAAVRAGMGVFGYGGGLTDAAVLAAAGAVTFDDMHDLVAQLAGA